MADLLQGLNEAQRKAVTSTDGFILAPARPGPSPIGSPSWLTSWVSCLVASSTTFSNKSGSVSTGLPEATNYVKGLRILKSFEDFWHNSLIIFDTSSLLRIYEWNIDKAIQLKDILACKIENIWIPNQVYIEFKKNKKGTQNQDKYAAIIEKLRFSPVNWDKIENMISKRWESFGYEYEFKEKVLEMKRTGVTSAKINVLNKMAQNINQTHRNNLGIEELFESLFFNVGEPFLDEQKEKILSEFETTLIAPGFMDKRKRNNNRHGDFFVWKQMCIKSVKSKTDIIFITADIKEDWFTEKNPKRPREYLLQDFKAQTGNDISIYCLTEFLRESQAYINDDIHELISYSNLQDEVVKLFDDYYPEDLSNKILEYITEDETIKGEMMNHLESCIDTISFSGINDFAFNLNDFSYEDYGCELVFHAFLDVTADFDGEAHCSGEDIELGTSSVILRVNINITVEKEWESEISGRFELCVGSENVEIVNVKFVELNEENNYQAKEYESEEYESDKYDY